MLLEDKLPPLARELAMGIYEVEAILERYGLSWDEYARVAALPRFQKLLETTTLEWGSTLNTRERIKVKSLAGVEDGLADLFKAAKDPKETLISRVEALKQARLLAGLGAAEGDGAGASAAEKFTLTINVGGATTEVGGSVGIAAASGGAGATSARDVTPGRIDLLL